MSEEPDLPGGTGAAEHPETRATTYTAGAMLRHIRESAGLDRAIVASALKITPQTLEALEQDRYEALPDLAFARSLAASICRNFGVDPAPVLAQLPQPDMAQLPMPEGGVNAPFHSASDRPMAMLPKYVSRPLTVVVALFLLGSLLLWLWPTLPIRLSDSPADVQTVSTDALPGIDVQDAQDLAQADTPPAAGGRLQPGALPADAVSATAQAAAEQQADADDADEAEEAMASAAEAAGADAADGSGAAEPAIDATDGDASVAVAALASNPDDSANNGNDATKEEEEAAAPAESDDLVIEASDESWVSVRDAGGNMLFNRLLEKGETARISGAKPLSATIGRKNAVTVLVHGEPFDHRSASTSSVSRFKVN
ncbi:MAG: helix-turn-helix domain-containing protein [Ottowia sp.]|nr:helix-turn-helix domain-containing protein [Ottowia sp.]